MIEVLYEFLSEELPHVRELVCRKIADCNQNPRQVIAQFAFNKFDLTIDFEADTVLIEDVTNPGLEGEHSMQLGEFVEALMPERKEDL
jgi:hypothetical protein